MEKNMICYTDIDSALGYIERINKGVRFLSQVLPYYPHAEGWEEIGTILDVLSREADRHVKEIEAVAGVEHPEQGA